VRRWWAAAWKTALREEARRYAHGESRLQADICSMKQVAAALIVQDDKVLICQRTRHQPMPLKWEFPGGKIENGEQPRDALRRELDEELGILARIGDEVARIRHNYKGGGAIELRFFLVNGYEGEVENRIFRDIRWVERENLPEYDFLEADITLVKQIAAGKVI
jgi:8-oxo-dGTP diphosphatase